MANLRYEPLHPLAKEELVSRLASDDPQTVASALYAASKYDEDWQWVQNQCLSHLNSPHVSIRWAAATCLGDLAFLRRLLDVDVVVPALEAATKDSGISDPASFSLSMVRQFLGGGDSQRQFLFGIVVVRSVRLLPQRYHVNDADGIYLRLLHNIVHSCDPIPSFRARVSMIVEGKHVEVS
jgi:hypothetical protein